MRLIDADWVEDLLLAHENNARTIAAGGKKVSFTYADGIRTAYADVCIAPTIDADLNNYGAWEVTHNVTDITWCSECGWTKGNDDRYYRYCPNCGCRMNRKAKE